MTTPHTPPAAPDLAAIEARAAAATRGPWHADHEFGYVDAPVLMRGAIVCSLDSDLCDDTDGADAEFIAHAREDIPALLAHIAAERERHAAEVAGAREKALREAGDLAWGRYLAHAEVIGPDVDVTDPGAMHTHGRMVEAESIRDAVAALGAKGGAE